MQGELGILEWSVTPTNHLDWATMGKLQQLVMRGKRAIGNRMVRNTFWLLLSRGGQLFIQSFYFVGITRSLGVEAYGGFMAVWALVWTVVPFSSWGWPNILVRNVSRDRRRFAESWGNALLVTGVLGCLFTGLILGVSRWLLPSSLPLSLVFYVAVSQLLFDRLTTVAGRVFQAFQRLRVTATLGVLTRARNLVAVVVFIALGQTHDVVFWSQLYCFSGGIVTAIGLSWVQWQFGSPKLNLAEIWQERVQGFYFAMGLSSQTIYNNVDKTMLARLSTLGATGMYAAGYRLVEISTTPIMALGGGGICAVFPEGKRWHSGQLDLGEKAHADGCWVWCLGWVGLAVGGAVYSGDFRRRVSGGGAGGANVCGDSLVEVITFFPLRCLDRSRVSKDAHGFAGADGVR